MILSWAKVRGYREGENPAQWRGRIDQLFPAKGKVRKVQHHRALPYADVPAFMKQLREQAGLSARALELLILTATRTSETLCATWNEFDRNAAVWTIPGSRMKASEDHRVPLSSPAVELLKVLTEFRVNEFVFPGMKPGRPLSQMSLLMLLRRMGYEDVTVHGFRSSFRDWAAERTSFPGEVAELALAHAVPNAVEAAYRRGDLLEKRRPLMEVWAEYCAGKRASGRVQWRSRQSHASANERWLS